MNVSDKSFEIVIVFFRIAIFGYGILSVLVLIYGIKSILTGRITIPEDSGFGLGKIVSSRPAIIPLVLNLFRHIMSPSVKTLSGSSARLMGVLYVITGLFMITPLIWAINKFNHELFNFK